MQGQGSGVIEPATHLDAATAWGGLDRIADQVGIDDAKAGWEIDGLLRDSDPQRHPLCRRLIPKDRAPLLNGLLQRYTARLGRAAHSEGHHIVDQLLDVIEGTEDRRLVGLPHGRDVAKQPDGGHVILDLVRQLRGHLAQRGERLQALDMLLEPSVLGQVRNLDQGKLPERAVGNQRREGAPPDLHLLLERSRLPPLQPVADLLPQPRAQHMGSYGASTVTDQATGATAARRLVTVPNRPVGLDEHDHVLNAIQKPLGAAELIDGRKQLPLDRIKLILAGLGLDPAGARGHAPDGTPGKLGALVAALHDATHPVPPAYRDKRADPRGQESAHADHDDRRLADLVEGVADYLLIQDGLGLAALRSLMNTRLNDAARPLVEPQRQRKRDHQRHDEERRAQADRDIAR